MMAHWDEHQGFPRSDWMAEVEAEDTSLGYWEWVVNKLDANGYDPIAQIKLQQIVKLATEAADYDEKMDLDGRPPNGDDYNELLGWVNSINGVLHATTVPHGVIANQEQIDRLAYLLSGRSKDGDENGVLILKQMSMGRYHALTTKDPAVIGLIAAWLSALQPGFEEDRFLNICYGGEGL